MHATCRGVGDSPWSRRNMAETNPIELIKLKKVKKLMRQKKKLTKLTKHNQLLFAPNGHAYRVAIFYFQEYIDIVSVRLPG